MWLFTIARNVELNQRRGLRRRDALVEKLQSLLEEVPAADSDHEHIRSAVAALPADQAELVRLVHWEGFRLVEAAEIQGTTASTARSRYAAARRALRQALAEQALPIAR